jgi:tetratricopeptide (TPR) repeat protein
VNRLAPFFALFFTLPLVAQDVFVPPVPKGIAKDSPKVRTPSGPIPFPAESGTWIRVRSPRFDVISSANERETRAIVNDIETLANALHAPPKASPTTVFLFAKRRESQPYFDLLFARERSAATGAYVRYEGGGTMFLDGSRKQRIERTAMHELVHDLLGARNLHAPLWLEEGLAEYFANATIRGNEVIAGEPIREHIALLQRRSPMPLAQLFAVQAESESATLPGFYAQSWMVVDWLMSLDQSAFLKFVDDVGRGVATEEALRLHFGKTPRDVEASLRRREFGARVVLPTRRSEGELIVEPVTRATLLHELGRFLSRVAGAEKDVQRHYAEVLRIDPQHARTLAAVGNLEAAVAAAPNDPEVHLLYAEVLMTTATGAFAGTFEPKPEDAEKFRKARALAERAIEIQGDEARARGLIGTSYLVESDVTPGIAQLERARALAPERNDFALNLYAMYFRTGQREKADALYAEAFAIARDKQTIFAARNIRYMAEANRANALATSGKLDEAAEVVRELAVATSDAGGRRELELQAANLESISTVNRHINTYNEAITLYNAGKYQQARKLIDELLKVATDPQIVKDAKALRADLRKLR